MTVTKKSEQRRGIDQKKLTKRGYDPLRHFRYRPLSSEGKHHYIKGQKRCHECEIFLEWNGLRCPCCGQRLRTKPRRSNAAGSTEKI